MTIVYSSDFTAGADTNLEAFGAPDWYVVYGGGGRSKVIAANDNVQIILTSELVAHGLTHSLIGSITDYEVAATVRRGTGFDIGGLAARCGAASSQTYYHLNTDSNNDMVLTRYNTATPTILKTTALSLPTGQSMPAVLRVTGTNPVILTYSLDGNEDTYSDSAAGRLTSGPPGLSLFRIATGQSLVWVDDLSVDDLVVVPSPSPGTEFGGFPTYHAYWKRLEEAKKKKQDYADRLERKRQASELRRAEEDLPSE